MRQPSGWPLSVAVVPTLYGLPPIRLVPLVVEPQLTQRSYIMDLLPPRLFKVVTISVYRTHQYIEAQTESEALEVAHLLSSPGQKIDERSAITVTATRKVCHG